MAGVKDIKDMATSLNVGLANLKEGKPLHKKVVAKVRARLHFIVALVGLGLVAAVGTYVAKKGLPDIDPVKVRGAGSTAGDITHIHLQRSKSIANHMTNHASRGVNFFENLFARGSIIK